MWLKWFRAANVIDIAIISATQLAKYKQQYAVIERRTK
jgi:hypothetical protein